MCNIARSERRAILFIDFGFSKSWPAVLPWPICLVLSECNNHMSYSAEKAGFKQIKYIMMMELCNNVEILTVHLLFISKHDVYSINTFSEKT